MWPQEGELVLILSFSLTVGPAYRLVFQISKPILSLDIVSSSFNKNHKNSVHGCFDGFSFPNFVEFKVDVSDVGPRSSLLVGCVEPNPAPPLD